MVLIFIFNYLAASCLHYFLSYAPQAYQINTSSFKHLVDDLLADAPIYAVTITTYFLIFGLFVSLLILTELSIHHQLCWHKFLSAVKRPKLYGFVLVLIIILLPLNELGLKIPVANYMTIPQTFMSMIANPFILTGLSLLYILILFLALRLKHIPYYLIIDGIKQESLIKKSWQATQKSAWHNFRQLGFIFVKIVFAFAILSGIQFFIDIANHRNWSVFTANLFTSLLAGVLYFYTATILYLFLSNPDQKRQVLPHQKYVHIRAVLFFVIIGFSTIFLSGKQLKVAHQNYLVIAHMGITSKSDIPNTIKNLKKVHATHPDYVEIDIQKTKDGQYVLSHDPAIKNQEDKSYQISDYSWDQLKDITFLHENQKTTLSNFKDYLILANELKQKLLVEVKFSQTVSNQELKAFSEDFGQLLAENKAQLQSLNQNSLIRIDQFLDNDLGLLSPIQNGVNQSKLSQFYAIESSSLTQKTITQATSVNKTIYAWTINSHKEIQTTYAVGVIGFITDYPAKTRQYLEKISDRPHYALVPTGTLLLKRSDF
ncbi:hypothetical protein RU86_GL000581 [Lactococcus piscium]|uniref:GP-PDE domain-containing protein n=2 Tax=Pseudolactococcus piscium TaxID=1364 RepID=A0A2A5RX55_9LACT|nr:hypothetical protein RU86_GL000581 [Lactococcus piscium]